jgi:hypothetical protein
MGNFLFIWYFAFVILKILWKPLKQRW